jgi:hypothetical protein
LQTLEDERELAAWLADGDSPAWFFLDSVDELKLTRGKFRRALKHFAKKAGGALGRAHVVISCRPTDWRPEQDLEAVRGALPLPSVPPAPPPQMSADEAFAAALREAETGRRDNEDDVGEVAREEGIRTVAMLPLGERQMRRSPTPSASASRPPSWPRSGGGTPGPSPGARRT